MKLSTTFRIALLSVSLGALAAAVPLSPRVSGNGITLGGAAFADEPTEDAVSVAEESEEPGLDDEDDEVSDCCDPSPGELAEAGFDYEGAAADADDGTDDGVSRAQERETRGADDNRDGDEMGVGTSFGRSDL